MAPVVGWFLFLENLIWPPKFNMTSIDICDNSCDKVNFNTGVLNFSCHRIWGWWLYNSLSIGLFSLLFRLPKTAVSVKCLEPHQVVEKDTINIFSCFITF